MEAMQERIDEFKAKGEKAAGGKRKPITDEDYFEANCETAEQGGKSNSVEDEFEAAVTKNVEDLTKLLEGSNSDDEELSVDEVAKDLGGNNVKTEVKDSETVDQDMKHLESLATMFYNNNAVYKYTSTGI